MILEQSGLQRVLSRTDTTVVLQGICNACRQVQEVQERLNAVQEELKLVVANAELARSHAITVLRKQAQLKEVQMPRCTEHGH